MASTETIFKAKVRRIGTSFGVLIPNQLMEKKSIKEGEEIYLAVLRKRVELIDQAFGMAKGSRHFHREESERN
ncbi:MAG: hypothetical protein LVQ63_05695 [Thermoplasmatales archaeon]|nr:hypothetical protein [Thermoplasmatales archaeon]